MSLEYLLFFGVALAAATVVATMGSEIADFVILQVKNIMK